MVGAQFNFLLAELRGPRGPGARGRLMGPAQLAERLLNVRPRVAMLSFSTRGSASHPSVVKVQAATELARKRAKDRYIEADFDGDLQYHCAHKRTELFDDRYLSNLRSTELL